MHESIATINSPEFINLTPLEINPLMSSCEIKVFYLGENRNGTFIDKEVATKMAKTLRGAPIVGYFKEENDDFRDHGERMIMDDEGFRFECLTVPYGFVAPDAQVWFKEFEESDEFGNHLTRNYLMTTGYLWTGQFEEARRVIEEGRPHSMEIDGETVEGHWATNNKTGMDFFIINDAIFSKLCILGNDVEPCFEGSRITAQEISSTFSKVDNNFKNTLYTMMQDLKFALEGGQDMTVNQEQEIVVEETVVEEATESTEEVIEETEVAETEVETTEATQETVETSTVEADQYAKEDEDEAEDKDEEEEKSTEDNAEEDSDDSEDKEKKYSLIETELSQLKDAYADLESKYQALVSFKEEVDNKEKEALIESFYMLSDEDKKEVVENKAKYSLEDIEAKLSVICVRNKVSFDLEDSSKNEEKVEEGKTVFTYTANIADTDSTPAFISALKKTRESNK